MLFFLVAFPCCRRHSSEWDTLLSIEKDIIDYPDSALTVLEAMDTSRLYGEEEKALYGLLLTMALSKNHIDIPDDSLIHSASRYFENKKDKRRSMIADCYLGMVQYDLERHSESIVNYYKAKQAAEELGDWFYAGLACRGLSDIYNDLQNKEEELTYAKEEYKFFKKCKLQPYLNYAMLDLGRALYNHSDYDSGLDILKQVIDSARVSGDSYLLISAKQLEASNLMLRGEHNKALPVLEEIINSTYADSQDSIRYWASLIFSGRKTEADILGNQMFLGDTSWHHVLKYMVYEKEGLIYEAFREQEAVDSIRDEVIARAMSNNIHGALISHVEMNTKLVSSNLKAYRLRFWLIIVSILFIAFIITLFLLKLFRKLKHERNSKVAFAGELQEALTESTHRYKELSDIIEKEKETQTLLTERLEEERLRREALIRILKEEEGSHAKLLQELEKEKTEQRNLLNNLEEEKAQRQVLIENLAREREVADQRKDVIKTLFAGQYKYLEDIIATIQGSKDTTTAKKKIADSMTALIDGLSSHSKTVGELEKKVDATYDFLMTDFRGDLPKLKEIDYRLFLFSVIRFSIPSISLLLKAGKVEEVYNRKRHLKDKIKHLDKQKADRYLSYLE